MSNPHEVAMTRVHGRLKHSEFCQCRSGYIRKLKCNRAKAKHSVFPPPPTLDSYTIIYAMPATLDSLPVEVMPTIQGSRIQLTDIV